MTKSDSLNPSSVLGREALEARLRLVAGQADPEIEPAVCALLLAALDRPRVPLERYRHHLSQLVRDTADLGAELGAATSLEARLQALHQVIVERHGYGGDERTYEDLQNANLMRVIDRRKGLPVSLGLLYIHAARGQGWPIDGLAFPGHFLLRLELDGAREILDPFHGRRRQPADLRELLKSMAGPEAELRPEHTTPVGNRDILLRLQNNIKLRLLRDERPEAALKVIESMLLFAPGHGPSWHEAGLLHANLGNLRAAILGLEHCLELGADTKTLHEAVRVLQEIKARLN